MKNNFKIIVATLPHLGQIEHMKTTLTHRRHTDSLTHGNVILFCDSDRNTGYGDHIWTLKTELPEVSDKVIEYAADFFAVEIEEARELCNPSDIVSTAGAWDDEQFCFEIASFFSPVGFSTPDGAIVFDRAEVEIEYSRE
jgi:hypothetical protein